MLASSGHHPALPPLWSIAPEALTDHPDRRRIAGAEAELWGGSDGNARCIHQGNRPHRSRRRAGRQALSDRLPHPWIFPLLVFAATWLLILATWYGSDAVYGRSHPWTWHFLIKGANFYLGIAEHGYTGYPARAAFFPLFPLLIHLTSYLTGSDYPVAGLIASVACGAASAAAP
jgi:hypothetical protein